ncbi:hypothetical protein [Streptomyces griseosporeus]|uniref:hypothetical protein n=1 Tax=Streptomyces griseosporeus TaxID=1910 RepID=UPI00167E82E0|nr:hypothetical protein [Streptomyces griseosporeus]GHF44810.1 hypothetical protein GCM10018783_12390 [Streptomyces griseosporeus]
MTDTRTPPIEPGAALPRAGRFFRPGRPAAVGGPRPAGVRAAGLPAPRSPGASAVSGRRRLPLMSAETSHPLRQTEDEAEPKEAL